MSEYKKNKEINMLTNADHVMLSVGHYPYHLRDGSNGIYFSMINVPRDFKIMAFMKESDCEELINHLNDVLKKIQNQNAKEPSTGR